MGLLMLVQVGGDRWVVKCKACRLKSEASSKPEAYRIWKEHRATTEHRVTVALKADRPERSLP